MGFPRKLKQMMLFVNGAWQDDNSAVTLPKFTRKFEEWRGGGMNRPVKIDMGGEALEVEWTCGGWVRDVLRQFGSASMSDQLLRWVGAVQDDSTGVVSSIEVTMRGRHEEVDLGESKPGEDTELKVKTALVYLKIDWDGVTEVEIDVLGMVEKFGGVDRMAEIRAAMGMI